jgi:hypothetical protein
MKVDPVLHRAVLDAVDRQITGKQPPEVNRTYNRLLAFGYSSDHARRQIALVLSLEMIRVLETRRPFHEGRYSAALRRLPRLPAMPEETGAP